MTKFIASFLKDESGAAAAEYALILAVVTAGIAAAAVALGDAVTDAIQGAADEITSQGS
jgi:pilus assembly protein Flp/PilA